MADQELQPVGQCLEQESAVVPVVAFVALLGQALEHRVLPIVEEWDEDREADPVLISIPEGGPVPILVTQPSVREGGIGICLQWQKERKLLMPMFRQSRV